MLMATLNQLQLVAMVTAARCQQHLAAETPPVVNLLPCTHIITLPLLSSVIQCHLKGRRQRKTKLSSCPYCVGNWVCALCSSSSPIDVAAITALQPGDWGLERASNTLSTTTPVSGGTGNYESPSPEGGDSASGESPSMHSYHHPSSGQFSDSVLSQGTRNSGRSIVPVITMPAIVPVLSAAQHNHLMLPLSLCCRQGTRKQKQDPKIHLYSLQHTPYIHTF